MLVQPMKLKKPKPDINIKVVYHQSKTEKESEGEVGNYVAWKK